MTPEETLTQAGIRPTAVRLMIWKQVRHEAHGIFSLADLQEALPTVERSTLFRTLALLSQHHLLHNVDDGTGTQKYCVCHHDDTRKCSGHVHLTCTHCHRTYCLAGVTIPPVPLPADFTPEETEYIVKGICHHCAQKRH
ncbi:MAG: transcriptional repressor [Bacteroidales bacterium]|nr:transcriptional repressor [Bacteroidales bacterium]